MNKINLSTTAGKVFWASLIGYCVAFGGFYLTTQHAHDKLVYEEEQGAFLKLKDVMCADGLCTDIKYENSYSVINKEYKTLVDLKSKNAPNEPLLQTRYKDFMSEMPWYIRMQFNEQLEVRSVNNKKVINHE